MTSPVELLPGKPVERLEVVLVDPPDPSLNQRFYRNVGADWKWTDRLVWNDDQWRCYVDRDAVVTGVCRIDGQEIGYFELELEDEGSVEIQYFGLLPGWIGKGIGSALLTEAVRHAWGDLGARRVWVHTCSNDHPHALTNYQRRGFRKYRTERSEMLAKV